MTLHHGFDAFVRTPDAVVTMGVFDGVHVGHRAVLDEVVRRAGGGPSVALTYEPHPREVLFGQTVPRLTTLGEKAARIAEAGVEHLVVLPFTRELAAWTAERFTRELLVGRIGLREAVLGHDHRFGARGAGDADLLTDLGRGLGFTVDVVPPRVVDGGVVSSSRIRQLLADEGDAAAAARLLGRPFALAGEVVHGDARGRTIGYPTANLRPDLGALVPRVGVYAATATTEAGEAWAAMVNIGVRPTFEGQDVRVEAHLLGFAGDLYGQALRLDVAARLRDERRFDGVDGLVRQLGEDAAMARAALGAVS